MQGWGMLMAFRATTHVHSTVLHTSLTMGLADHCFAVGRAQVRKEARGPRAKQAPAEAFQDILAACDRCCQVLCTLPSPSEGASSCQLQGCITQGSGAFPT
jgi:hypothetical protein